MKDPSLPKIIKKVLPAVVSITASKNLKEIESPFGSQDSETYFNLPKEKKVEIGGGSGFIVDPSGIILTNRHVVNDPEADYLIISHDEKKYPAEVLARDPINDVAVVKINPLKSGRGSFPIIALGNSSRLELGQTVIAIGNTLGVFRNTVSTGVVSGLSRYITAFNSLDNKAQRLRGLIQTDAAINPGSSGGPLIDIHGRAIGINAAMIFGAENVGFALPVNAAKRDLEDIKKYNRIRFPFLGLRYVLLNPDIQKRYNFPLDYGALVIAEDPISGWAVIPGSPAFKAGIKEADVILEVFPTATKAAQELEGERVSIENPLEDILQKFNVDQTLGLKVFRQGKEIICEIKIGEKNGSETVE